MKISVVQFCLVVLIGIIAGCGKKSKEELFQGKWEFVSSYDLDSARILVRAKPNDAMFATIDAKKIVLTEERKPYRDEVYFWKLEGDSLVLKPKDRNRTYMAYLHALDEQKFEVEIDFLGKALLEFKRINN